MKFLLVSVLLLINQICCSVLNDPAKRLDRLLVYHRFQEADSLLMSSPDILQTVCTSQVISRCIDLRNYQPHVRDHVTGEKRLRRSFIDSVSMGSDTIETAIIQAEGTRIFLLLLPFASKKILTRALNSAIFHRDEELIERLFKDRSVTFFEADEEGISPLMMSVKFKRLNWFYWLLDHGADLRYVNHKGENIVHDIAKFSTSDMTFISRIFFEMGLKKSDLTLENNQGQRPLDLALAKNNQIVIDLLQNPSSSTNN